MECKASRALRESASASNGESMNHCQKKESRDHVFSEAHLDADLKCKRTAHAPVWELVECYDTGS